MKQDEIRNALASEDRPTVRAAIAAAEQAAPELDDKAAAMETESLNPALTDAQASKARDAAAQARFAAERMQAALTALQERDEALEAQEGEEARQSRYDAAHAALEAAVARHGAEWDKHALALAGIVREIEAAKMAIAQVNDDLPQDAPRLALPGSLAEIRTQAKRLRTSDGARLLGDWPGHDGGPGHAPLEIIEGSKVA